MYVALLASRSFDCDRDETQQLQELFHQALRWSSRVEAEGGANDADFGDEDKRMEELRANNPGRVTMFKPAVVGRGGTGKKFGDNKNIRQTTT
eukprot:GSA25T00011677001.1